MEFTVPQIGREPKIFGPFSFKQFLFLALAGALVVFLYFFIKSFFFFFLIAVTLIGGTLILTFWKIEGVPLISVMGHFFAFLAQPRIFLWKKKNILPKILTKKKKKKKAKKEVEEVKKGSVLKITERSNLRKLTVFLETKAK